MKPIAKCTNPRKSTTSLWEQTTRALRDLSKLLSSQSARSGLLSLIDQGILSATSFVTGIVIARLTSQAELGVYYLALSLVLFARSFQTEVILGPYVIYHHRYRGHRLASYTGSVLVHIGVFCLVATLAGSLFFYAMRLGGIAQDRGLLMAVVVVAISLLLLRENARHMLMAHLRMGTSLVLDAIYATVVVGTLATMVYTGRGSVIGVFLAMAAGGLIAAVGWTWLSWSSWKVRWSRVLADWYRNWRFGRWAMAGYMIGYTTPYFMPWIVAATHGEATAGLFGACGTLAGIANMFVMGLGNFISPKTAAVFSEGGPVALRQFVSKAIAVCVAVVGLFVVLAAIGGEYAMVWIYGTRYAGGGIVVTVCVLAILAMAVGWTAGCAIWAMDRPRATFVADVAGLLTTVATAILFVWPLGALGAALAEFLGTSVSALTKYLTYRRLLNEKLMDQRLAVS